MSFQLKPNADTNGTWLQGHVKASYPELEALFGKPTKSDEYKISGEWVFYDNVSKEVFTLYDWKLTSLYDPSLPSVEEFRKSDTTEVFNVGGRTSAEDFIAWLESEIGKVKWENSNL
jgi:hypothetical protein